MRYLRARSNDRPEKSKKLRYSDATNWLKSLLQRDTGREKINKSQDKNISHELSDLFFFFLGQQGGSSAQNRGQATLGDRVKLIILFPLLNENKSFFFLKRIQF